MENTLIAGVVRATCSCCAEPRLLLNHLQLGASRMYCPVTQRTYVDRGDGLFRADGITMSPAVAELLDDRPARSDEKTRIQLERATFAGVACEVKS